MLIDELLAYLFDEQPHLLAAPMATWLASSRRFTAFVTEFRSKIRKKLRATQERESLHDLRLELETAYLLLQERSLSVVYEPQPLGQSRCPDFAVTFTTSMVFMVEVTRLRMSQDQAQATPDAPPLLPPMAERLVDSVCSKLGQLLLQHGNVLLIGVEAASITQETLRAAMLTIQQRAERNDPSIVQRHRFRDRAHFFQHYQRLSEIVVRGSHGQPREQAIVWVNPQAKYPLPGKVQTALHRSISI
jgi:hypothetical protein